MRLPSIPPPIHRSIRFLSRHGQTLLSGGVLAVGVFLFGLGCGGGKDGVIPTPPTTTTGSPTTATTTTGGSVDFNIFPEKVLLTERTSRGAVEITLSVAPNRPLSVILFQTNPTQAPELHFDADARYTGFGLGGRFAGEFVPYLRMSVEITNESTMERTETELVPAIGLSDGLHYARNLRLPGLADAYTVRLKVRGPEPLGAGSGETAVLYGSDMTPAGLSGTVVQPNFSATYTGRLIPAQLVPPPATTTTTTNGTPTVTTTTGPPPTTTTGG
ncbi:MAG: iron transporter, partial [Armatimonadetes bacterium]|nr:iron transporter [Armatimonadota bacterium]